MKLVTWNVNSVRARLERVVAYFRKAAPDVACLQETKVVDADFPVEAFRELCYHATFHGQKTYNGVAILSREAPADVVRGMQDGDPDADARLLAVTVAGMSVVDVYVPNGQEVGSPKYDFKLRWLARLRAFLDKNFRKEQPLVVCGDFNVAPEDRDVWDAEKWRGQVLFSEPEKAALKQVSDFGLIDALREKNQDSGVYTWWDYRNGSFPRGWGLRIDHFLMSAALIGRLRAVTVERDERKGPNPSDHAPVVAELESPA